MPIDPKDLELLRAHYQKHAKRTASTCPVCNTNNWDAHGPVTYLDYVHEKGVVLSGRTTPVMLLICKSCYFVRQFAWVPIKGAPQNG